MTEQALDILEHVIREKPGREKRTIRLLKDPAAETTDGWHMCVPSYFNDALDIRLTERKVNKKPTLVWTQGASFSFKVGDTLYDTLDAYKSWSDALRTIDLCAQVKMGSNAGPVDSNSGRFDGLVKFSIFTPTQDRSRLVERSEHTMSQDDFVRFLISGLPEEPKLFPV